MYGSNELREKLREIVNNTWRKKNCFATRRRVYDKRRNKEDVRNYQKIVRNTALKR